MLLFPPLFQIHSSLMLPLLHPNSVLPLSSPNLCSPPDLQICFSLIPPVVWTSCISTLCILQYKPIWLLHSIAYSSAFTYIWLILCLFGLLSNLTSDLWPTPVSKDHSENYRTYPHIVWVAKHISWSQVLPVLRADPRVRPEWVWSQMGVELNR